MLEGSRLIVVSDNLHWSYGPIKHICVISVQFFGDCIKEIIFLNMKNISVE